MGYGSNYQNGRAPAIFFLGIFTGITLILLVSHLLSHEGEFHISLVPLYVWEAILYIISILGMSLFVLFKGNGRVTISTDEEISFDIAHNGQRAKPSWWTRIPVQMIVFVFCALGNISLLLYELYRTIHNLVCLEVKEEQLLTLFIVKCVCYFFSVLFCVFQLVFLVKFQSSSSSCWIVKCFLSSCIAANLTICVNVILDIIWASNTMQMLYQLHTNQNNMTTDLIENGIFIKCANHSADIDQTRLIVSKFAYQFPIEYGLLALTFYFGIWNVIACTEKATRSAGRHERTRAISETSRETECDDTISIEQNEGIESTPLVRKTVLRRGKCVRKAFRRTALFIAEHAIIWTLALIVGVFVSQICTDTRIGTIYNIYFKHNTTEKYSLKQEWYSILQTVYTYILCIVAFIGFTLARTESDEHTSQNPKAVMLVVGAAGHLLFILFETIDSIEQFMGDQAEKNMAEKVLFLIKIILHYLGLYSQTILVLKSYKMKIRKSSMQRGKQLFIKGIVVFIGVCNAERWMADNFLPPTALKHINEIHSQNENDEIVWWFLTKLLYPLIAVYRLLSAVISFEACARINRETR